MAKARIQNNEMNRNSKHTSIEFRLSLVDFISIIFSRSPIKRERFIAIVARCANLISIKWIRT